MTPALHTTRRLLVSEDVQVRFAVTDHLFKTIRDDFRSSPGMVVESAACACFVVLFVVVCVGWAVGVGG